MAGTSASCPTHKPSQKQAAMRQEAPMPCPLSKQWDESMNLQFILQSSCKMMARALPGLILVLLKGQGCAAYLGL